jgi:hypothetical protein
MGGAQVSPQEGRPKTPSPADARESEFRRQHSDFSSARALTLQPVPVSALQKLKGR